MAGFEDLIRKAIANQGRAMPEERAAVYESSRAALDRMLAKSASVSPAAGAAQRERLEQAITDIEADYRRGQPSGTPPPMPPSVSRPQRLEPEAGAMDVGANRDLPQEEQAPSIAVEAAPSEQGVEQPEEVAVVVEPDPTPEVQAADPHGELSASRDDGQNTEVENSQEPPESYSGDALRKKRPYARMLAWVIILTGIGVAAWWAYNFGTKFVEDSLGGSVPNPQEVTELGPFVPEDGDAEGRWLTIFNPARDAASLVTGARGSATLVERDGAQVMRIASANNTESGNILVRLPRGIVEAIRGKAATFDVIAKGPPDGDTADQQVAIFCQFGAMGTCGRKRFEVGNGRDSHIFDVLTEDVALGADEEAHLAINTDLSGPQRSIDIIGIRVRTGS